EAAVALAQLELGAELEVRQDAGSDAATQFQGQRMSLVTLRDQKVAGLLAKEVVSGNGVNRDLVRAGSRHVGAFTRDPVSATTGAGLIDGHLTEGRPLAARHRLRERRAILRKGRLGNCQTKKNHAPLE